MTSRSTAATVSPMTTFERPFLDSSAAVPVDRPFTTATALAEGVGHTQLASWVGSGLLVRPFRGVYYASQLDDGLELRAACVALVVPSDAVIVGRTAGWLHGATMALAPNDHLEVPNVEVVRTLAGYRLRNPWALGGERQLAEDEITELFGLPVTTDVRTAFDLGCQRNRYAAFAGMEMVRRQTKFALAQLLEYGERGRGRRWIVPFREMAPDVGTLSESPPEAAIKRRWKDCRNLPPVEQQIEVPAPSGSYFLDLGNRDIGYAMEYDGALWHPPERQQEDRERRDHVRQAGSWIIDVAVRHDVYEPTLKLETMLYDGVARARRAYGRRSWTGRTRPDGRYSA